MVRFSRLLNALSEVPDPRRAEGKRYPLAPLLLFTVLALLSGATSYRRIIIFLEQRRITLNEVFSVALKRAPSVNTLRPCFRTWTATPWNRRSAGTPRACCRTGTDAGRGTRRQDLEGQLRPPHRPQGGPGAERLRLRGGDPAGAQRNRRQEQRDPGGATDDRRVGSDRRAVHRRRLALSKKPLRRPATAATPCSPRSTADPAARGHRRHPVSGR